MRIPLGIGVSMLTLGLSACNTLSPDGGESAVRAATAERLGAAIMVSATGETLSQRREELLSAAIDGDSAVTLALLNSPVLQRLFAALSLTEAEIVAASRLPNPRLSLARLRQGGDRESDRAVSLDLISLLTTPLRASLGKKERMAARLAAEQTVLALAGD